MKNTIQGTVEGGRMRQLLHAAVLWVCLLCSSAVSARVEHAHFVHYGNKEGLVSNLVLSLDFDDRGFLWAATNYGLARFDGKHFRHLRKSEYPYLPREDFFAVGYMGNNRLAVGSFNGLVLEYNIDEDRFEDKMPHHFGQTYYKSITSFYRSPQHNFFALTSGGGIYKYDTLRKEYTHKFPAFEPLQNMAVRSLYEDSRRRLWVGGIDQLMVVDEKGHMVYSFTPHDRPCGFIFSIIPLGDGRVAIASSSPEVWIYDSYSDTIKAPLVVKLPFENVTAMLKDRRGRFWFATDGNGLWYADDIERPDFVEILPYNSEPGAISKIYSMTEDSNGNVWIGTCNSGIWGYIQRNHVLAKGDEGAFGTYFSSERGFPNMVCSSFWEDGLGNLYVGTDGKGLYRVSRDFSQITNIPLPCNNVVSMAWDPVTSTLCAATWGKGIVHYDPRGGKTWTEKFKGLNKPMYNLFSVNMTPQGEMMCCTASDGLYRRRPLAQEWERVPLEDTARGMPSNEWVYKTVDGPDGTRWIMTTNTVWREANGHRRVPLTENIAVQKTHLPLAFTDAVTAKNGDLLLATNHGVMRISADGSRIDTLDFLPRAVYSVILKDRDGNIWAAGNEGIVTFDPADHTCRLLPGNFTDKTRFSFTPRAGYLTLAGKLMIGTNSGFFCFDPQRAIEEGKIDYLAFGDLYLDQKKVFPGDDPIGKGNLKTTETLELPYNQTDIGIGVDLIDYDGFNPACVKYQLVGFDRGENTLRAGDNITFNHLPSGEYTLQVRAFRPNVKDVEKQIEMKITVAQPWWNTWTFRLVAVLLLAGLVAAWVRYRMARLERERTALARNVDERTRELRVALADKNRIIAVVGHDLKSPMFGIVNALRGFADKYASMFSPQQSETLDSIVKSATGLQGEMVKLLEWAHSAQNDVAWKPEELNMSQICQNVLALLASQAGAKKIKTTMSFSLRHTVVADVRSLEVIVRNLVANAIKFTPAGGRVEIKAYEDSGMAMVSVTDSGVGMDADMQRELSKPGVHISHAGTQDETGTGLGVDICHSYVKRNGGALTYHSLPHGGTEARFTLPLGSGAVAEKTENEENTPETPQAEETTIDTSLLEGNLVLVADDDELIRNSLKAVIERYARVVTATDGRQALEMTREQSPDIVISDVAMPQMDGIELGRQLAVAADTNYIPLLYISANNDEGDRLLGLLSGAIDYIPKPFSNTELLIKLTNILRLRQKQQLRLMRQLYIESDGGVSGAKDETGNQILNPDLKAFFDVLERRYRDKNLQIADLAHEMGISQSALGRRLKALTGKTSVEILLEYRLCKALPLLRMSTSATLVTDVAYEVGFADPSYFTRKFKDYYGYPPSHVKKT